MNLILYMPKMHHPTALQKTGIINLIVCDIRSRTIFVKVVYNRLLCQKTTMLCANKQYCYVTYHKIETSLEIV